MKKDKDLMKLMLVLVLLGVTTGLISVNLELLSQYSSIDLGVIYTYWTGGSGGNNNPET